MEPAIDRVGESRDDYEIFTGIAERMGVAASFTEGRTSQQWIRHLWAEFRGVLPDLP